MSRDLTPEELVRGILLVAFIGIAAAAAIVLGTVLAGCVPFEMTLQPDVVLDADLGERDTQEVIDGIEAWSAVVPEVRPHFQMWTHGDVLAQAGGEHLRPNTVYVIAIPGNDVRGCPAGDGEPLGGYLGRNKRKKNGSSALCIDVGPRGAEVDPDDHGRRQVAAHEFGHAMGIPHAGPGRLMYALADENQLPLPSCEDGRALAAHWGGVEVAKPCR